MRIVAILFSIISLATLVLIQEHRPQLSITEKISFRFNERYPTFNAETLDLMSFGYSRVLSNLLWIRFILQTPPERVPENELSWIYFDLDTITNIDPDFTPAFEIGGLFLSVITTDKKGAETILKKGLSLYPNNWRLHATIAYHYNFELNKPKEAGEHYIAAAKIPGAPDIFGILAARYLSKKESIDSSISFLETLYKNNSDPLTRKRIQERIDMWKKTQRKQK